MRIGHCIVLSIVLWICAILYAFVSFTSEKHTLTDDHLRMVAVNVDSVIKENLRLKTQLTQCNRRLKVEENKDVHVRQLAKAEISRCSNTSNLKIRSLEGMISEIKNTTVERSLRYDKLSRQISNQLMEMWYLISSGLQAVRKTTGKLETNQILETIKRFREINQITERDFEELTSMDGVRNIKDLLAKELSAEIQNRLKRLQNPANCPKARKLVCTLKKPCGYACQMHHLLYCFIVAYSTNRVFVIDSKSWKYTRLGWNSYFETVSNHTCNSYTSTQMWDKNHNTYKIVQLPNIGVFHPRPRLMPMAVPKDIYDRLSKFSGKPFVWWAGQFLKYMFRYTPKMKSKIEETKRKLNFKGPVIGLHIRRTDKIGKEAAFHSIREYMEWVEHYFRKLQLSKHVDIKRVYIASDDSNVLHEARKQYPEYTFLSNTEASNHAKPNTRYTDASLSGIITDIELLSECDYLVCTFSSQVCRLAYELMNSKHTDASKNFRSLDDIYYFGGQSEHKMRVIRPHKGVGKSNELNLNVGEEIKILGNHWNGLAKGQVNRKSGLFPAFKVEDIHRVE